jgi:hypothetical protein
MKAPTIKRESKLSMITTLSRWRDRALRTLFVSLWVSPITNVDAQMALSGYWDPIYHEDFEERVSGPAIGDYTGLPINDAARIRADTWDASLLTVPERQCIPHPSTYGFRAVGTLRIQETRAHETEELSKIETWITWQDQHREIWMDGRPSPPPNALHTWQGYSVGRWDGNTLVVTTDHLKAGWIRRNGLPLSDLATMKEYFFRHGDILTQVTLVSDPVYLTEPLVKTNGFSYVLNGTTMPYPCRPVTEVARPRGAVPHHLPGKNTFLDEFARAHCIPIEASRGGARTALPEFMDYMDTLTSMQPTCSGN